MLDNNKVEFGEAARDLLSAGQSARSKLYESVASGSKVRLSSVCRRLNGDEVKGRSTFPAREPSSDFGHSARVSRRGWHKVHGALQKLYHAFVFFLRWLPFALPKK